MISCTSSKKNRGLYLIVALLLRDHPTVHNRLNRPSTRCDCDNVWAPLKFNDCLAWPLTSNSNRMLSLLAMLKLVTLKGCFHDMQQNAEQQREKYYRNKRRRPTFKPALSLACPPTTRSKTGQSQQRRRSVYMECINMDQDYIHFTRSSTGDRDAGGSRNIRLVRQDYIFVSIYNIAYLLSMSIPFPV